MGFGVQEGDVRDVKGSWVRDDLPRLPAPRRLLGPPPHVHAVDNHAVLRPEDLDDSALLPCLRSVDDLHFVPFENGPSGVPGPGGMGNGKGEGFKSNVCRVMISPCACINVRNVSEEVSVLVHEGTLRAFQHLENLSQEGRSFAPPVPRGGEMRMFMSSRHL